MSTFGKATKSQLLVVNQCKTQPGMEPLRGLFESSLNDVKSALVRAVDTVHIHRLQGRAEALNDFLELLDNAAQIAERVK